MPKLGQLTKGSLGSQEFGVYGFAGGLNARGFRSPQLLADSDLTDAYNGYVTSGGFVMRNGMSSYQSSIVAGSNPCVGLARFFQQVKNGASVSVTKTLAQVADTLYDAVTPASIGSLGTGTSPMIWCRAQDPNDPNFVSGKTDVIVICSGSAGPYIYDGTNLYAPAGWSSAAGAKYCALVNGIVYFAGMPTAPRTVLGTGDGTTNKSFETLDATALFVMSNPITGLCSLGTGAPSSLCIGQSNGLSVLYGTGTSNFQIQDIPFFFDGPVSGRAMIYEAGTMYFLGKQAVYAFDGQSTPVPISIKVEPWILNDLYVPGYPMSGDRSKSFMFVYNNRLHVGYINGNGTVPNTLLVYDLVLKAWTVLQTTPGIYCAAALDAPSDSAPTAFIVGSSAGPAVLNWDVESAIGTVPTDNGTAITCSMRTKYFKVGQPGTTKVLTRTYPEFFLNGNVTGTQQVLSDYGNASTTNTFTVTSSGQESYSAPLSRQDWSVQADSFAFAVKTTGSSCAWTLSGLTAVYTQQGKASGT